MNETATNRSLIEAVEALTARVEDLEADNQRLRAAADEESQAPSPLTRRRLVVGGVGAVAAGLAGTVLGTRPAAANGQGQSFTLGDPSNSATNTTGVFATFNDRAVLNVANNGTASAVYARIGSISGIVASAAITGDSADGIGTCGLSANTVGVYGRSTNSNGVSGFGAGVGSVGVYGVGPQNEGVHGFGRNGVVGETATAGGAGVIGRISGNVAADGVVGISHADHVSGVYGFSDAIDGYGVFGRGAVGVSGETDHVGRAAVEGIHTNFFGGFGVKGQGSEIGVWGLGTASGAAGMRAESTSGGPGLDAHGDGEGVTAFGANGHGVTAATGSAFSAGVAGTNNAGKGVWGFGLVGVQGEGMSGGTGVVGRGAVNGVQGNSPTGVGGRFSGARAAISLAPRTTVGRPTSGFHGKGDIVIDSNGATFVCTANGTPGTWVKVTTTPA